MKNLITTILIIFASSCKAQTPIIPIYDAGPMDINGAYYKDTDNFYNQFVGTWVFNDGTTYLKVTFKLKTMFHVNNAFNNYYTDYLIGEYEYKVNNVSVVNSLANLDINHTSIYDYNLWSLDVIHKALYPPCTSCDINEKRVVMDFQELATRDPNWAATAQFIMRHVVISGIEKLNVQFLMKDPAGSIPEALASDDAYQGFSLPFGDYVLTKI
jgi:hypothetical protein